jgi:hypothetical protein
MNKTKQIQWCKHSINKKFCVKCRSSKPQHDCSVRPAWAELALRPTKPKLVGKDFFTTIEGI